MRRWILPLIVAILLFWPLVTILVLGYRWSVVIVERLSPTTSAAQPSASPLGPSFLPAPPAPAAQPPPAKDHSSRPVPLTEKDLERLDQEFFDSQVRR